ncbi:MAG: tRNA (adenosine(37)-N6)-dimethylallyltransferase MiaA [Clostridiales bacterium]|nr:tRNA (adenosine(37)-N6)-dimethylallyltransferase MiaA [Clostridiales bacterium]
MSLHPTKILCIIGPTASGKSDVALELANKLSGEIISADSMQIYRYMDIGTAKPTKQEQEAVRHWMIDIVNPDADYSVNNYVEDVSAVISEVSSRGKLPIICGGTGLYLNSLIYDYKMTDAGKDDNYRSELYEFAEKFGVVAMHDKLRSVDNVSANNIHPNNVKRVVRALEVYHCTGIPMSEQNNNQKTLSSKFDAKIIGISRERCELYDRINRRVDIMVHQGLVDEVKSLLEMGYTGNLNSMQGIGYKEFIPYLDSECSLNDAIELVKKNTRNYAKRQLTWFNAIENVIWKDTPSDILSMDFDF